MERLTVLQFLQDNEEFLFPNSKYSYEEVVNMLVAAPQTFELTMNNIEFKKPSTLQILSVFPGQLGVDRFYLSDNVWGLVKFITHGGLGVWWVLDIISAKKRCRDYNCTKLLSALTNPLAATKFSRF